MKIIFAHGKESGPLGTKIQALARVAEKHGFQWESPDFTDSLDPDVRVKMLLAMAEDERETPLVLTGSSMGGYVVTAASGLLRPAGLFLMAPAFYLPGYAVAEPLPCAGKIAVVHGWQDEVVPPENSIRFARRHWADLHLLRAGHSLTERIPVIERLFAGFLEDVNRPGF